MLLQFPGFWKAIYSYKLISNIRATTSMSRTPSIGHRVCLYDRKTGKLYINSFVSTSCIIIGVSIFGYTAMGRYAVVLNISVYKLVLTIRD